MLRRHDSLHPVLPAWPPCPRQALHDAAASRALEQQAQAALPPHTLMARAGLAVARLALAAWPAARRVQALAGPGNNGGDALLAARWLQRQGLSVRVHLLGDPDRLPDDARWALQQCRDQGLAIEAGPPPVLDADLLVDGLLGLGARRAPEGAIAEAIRGLAMHRARVLAVDLPSGLAGDTGQPLGDAVVTAAHTLSLLTLKPGLFTAHGRDHAGRVWLDRLGVDPAPSPLTLGGDGVAADGASTSHGSSAAHARDASIAPRASNASHASHASHKGSFGDVTVIGGAPGMAGAARLAAWAALAAGAGRVFLGLLDATGPATDPLRPELMQRSVDQLTTPQRLRAATVVCGCGGGDAVAAALPAVLTHAARLLLDADALNAVAADPQLRQRLRARAAHGRPTVLTPHPLEAARLLGSDAREVQADRFGAALALAAELDCVVVLKGSGTLVAQPDGRVTVNPTGNARLASAGTGDVLAGWIGGRWARSGGAAAAVAIDGVFRHGLAAEQAPGHGPLRAGDLVDAMR